MSKDFVHLHVHTQYSLLDGAAKITGLMKRTAELGMSSIAITDHGVMYGIVEFYKEAKKSGIKPILGCEVYTARRSRFDKESGIDSDYGHLVLLAKSNVGYQNLMKIVSAGFVEGFYYKPRVDLDVLELYNEGIIALSACIAGDVPRLILNDDYEGAKKLALKFNKIFGSGSFFLELQQHGIKEQDAANRGLIKISEETNIPLVATNDAHYLSKDDFHAHEVLLCIQTGKNINDEGRFRFSQNEFYIKSKEEMYDLFKYVPEAIENTVKIANECNVELEFNKVYLPKYEVPELHSNVSYLRELCFQGLKRLYKEDTSEEKIKRLEYELSVIEAMGYVDYFLIVWDLIKYAKDHEIMVGPGRGSAAGSFVAYCLGITELDPLRYNLLFERFLNPERISMPDIDIDFCFERRQEVIDYVISKYGNDKVAQIITFGTMAARAAIRDVGRALGVPYNEVDSLAKMIPFQLGINIDKALEINAELKSRCNQDPTSSDIISTAKNLEGMPRHASIHAAGVVISKDPITNYVPIQKTESGITTQFPMGTLEDIGLLKIDFLGLRTLTVIREAIELVHKNHDKTIKFSEMDTDDPNVYKLISEGKTLGIFQIEGTGMAQFMKELKPSSFEDLIAGISLYRPGPMDQIPRYIKNKNSLENIEYAHELLKNILDVTYGCMIYQEQVMQIVRDLAGYSMGRADLVRRAMSKKKVDVMEQERHNFIYGAVDKDGTVISEGAIKKGISEELLNKIFDEMMDFASYAFNKSHGAAYAVIAYQTAWLKNYYPVEYMAALLNSFLNNSDKVSQYINECKNMKIEVLPPDINESNVRFAVINGRIRFGLVAIKNAGEIAMNEIVMEREKIGAFIDFRDFCERISNKDINKRCVESLIKSGAFDSSGIYRSRLLAMFEKIIDSIAVSRKTVLEGQMGLFDICKNDNVDKSGADHDRYPDIQEFPNKVILSMEKEMLGLYVSGHPLKEFEEDLKRQVTHFSSDFNVDTDEIDGVQPVSCQNLSDGEKITVGGIISAKKTKMSKNNNLIAFVTLDDLYGAIEVIVFPTVFEKYSGIIVEENIVLIRGKLSMREDEQPKVICEEIKPLKKEPIRKLYLNISDQQDDIIHSITALLKFFRGNTPVYFYNDTDKKSILLSQDCWVDLSNTVMAELKARIGDLNINLK